MPRSQDPVHDETFRDLAFAIRERIRASGRKELTDVVSERAFVNLAICDETSESTLLGNSGVSKKPSVFGDASRSETSTPRPCSPNPNSETTKLSFEDTPANVRTSITRVTLAACNVVATSDMPSTETNALLQKYGDIERYPERWQWYRTLR